MIEGLGDTGMDVTNISPKSWHPDCLLQEVKVQLRGIETLSQVKQSTKWIKCIGPEGQVGKLKPYVVNVTMNLLVCDLLQS